MIRIRNLAKSVIPDGTLFENVDLDIAKGDFVVILGSSGSGKTSMLRCLSLFEDWDKGTFVYNDQNIFELGAKGKRIIRKEWAMIEEKPTLFREKSALKNVLMGSRKHRSIFRKATFSIPEQEYTNAMDFLQYVGLLDKAHQKVGNMSGGEVQRVAIANALAQGAKVVVADEPVSNLDPHTAETIMEKMQQMCKEKGLTIICTLQQTDLANRYANRIIGLANQRIAFEVIGRRLTFEEREMIL